MQPADRNMRSWLASSSLGMANFEMRLKLWNCRKLKRLAMAEDSQEKIIQVDISWHILSLVSFPLVRVAWIVCRDDSQTKLSTVQKEFRNREEFSLTVAWNCSSRVEQTRPTLLLETGGQCPDCKHWDSTSCTLLHLWCSEANESHAQYVTRLQSGSQDWIPVCRDNNGLVSLQHFANLPKQGLFCKHHLECVFVWYGCQFGLGEMLAPVLCVIWPAFRRERSVWSSNDAGSSLSLFILLLADTGGPAFSAQETTSRMQNTRRWRREAKSSEEVLVDFSNASGDPSHSRPSLGALAQHDTAALWYCHALNIAATQDFEQNVMTLMTMSLISVIFCPKIPLIVHVKQPLARCCFLSLFSWYPNVMTFASNTTRGQFGGRISMLQFHDGTALELLSSTKAPTVDHVVLDLFSL